MTDAFRAAGRPSRGFLKFSLFIGCALGALAAPGVAIAQDDAAAERITVTGTRIIRSGMVTPTPVTVVGGAELENMAPGTLLDSLAELPTFSNNLVPEQVSGGQNSGGSNVNLRGAGANRTLVLLDGRRLVPSNRFGTVDVAMIPSELLRSVETVTGGASASYGTDAVAGVVNFILDTDFEGFKAHAQYGETRYGDGATYEVGGAFGMAVGERGHLIASLETFNVDAISSFESLDDRDFFQHRARVTNPGYNATTNPNVPQNLILPYVVPTNWNNTGMIIQPGSSLNRRVFNPDGTTSPFVFSGIGAVGSGCNCMASSTPSHGVDSDDEVAAGNERTSGFLYYEHEVTDWLKLYGQVLAGRNEVDDRRENISFILTWMPRIFADNAYLPASTAQAIQTGGSIVAGSNGVPSVGYALFGINDGAHGLPDTRQITINEMISGTVGFDAEIGGGLLDGWTVRGYYQRGENDQSFDTDNGIRVDRIPLALDAVVHPTTGEIVCQVAVVDPVNFGDCVPMNIFGGLQNLTDEARAYIVDDYKHAIQHTTQDFAEIVASGDIWSGFGNAGPISGAVGASYRKETLDQSTPDPTDEFPATPSGVLLSDLGLLAPGIRGLIPQNLPGGIPGVRNVPVGFTGDANSSSVTFSSLRAITGSYDVKEAFGELNVPLLSGLPFAEQLDVNGALRWADYEGSGEIWAWKYGASWQITNDFRLRATQSRDVRAATLRERFDQTRGGVNVSDPENGGAVISTASLSGGNENVMPEEADTTTIGFVYQPSFVDNFGLSLDWYNIEIADAINQLGAQNVVTGCFNGDTFLCQFVIRDTSNQIIRVDNLFFNVETQVIEGVDLEASYGWRDFDFRLFASYLIENSIKNPGGATVDRAGDIGVFSLPELKVTANVSYNRGPFSVFAQERYIDGGLIDRTQTEGVTVNDNTVPETFYTDIGATWQLVDDDSQWQIFGNIDNLFDQEPRATPGVVGRAGTTEFNRSVYDVLGRRFTVGVRVAF